MDFNKCVENSLKTASIRMNRGKREELNEDKNNCYRMQKFYNPELIGEQP